MSLSRDFAQQLIDHSRIVESGRLLDPKLIATVVKRIVDLERQVGGPYGPPDEKLDFGLNIAIARFLRSQTVRLPRLDSFIARARERNETGSVCLDPRQVVESMTIYDQDRSPQFEDRKSIALRSKEQRALMTIKRGLSRRLKRLDPAFKKTARDVIERTIAGNPDGQMSLMPLYLRQALGKRGKVFDSRELAEMGLANTCFWTAFIIYDDFWDEDEAAAPQLLPVANLFTRHYIDYFERVLPEKTGFRTFFHRLMDQLDAANAWETRVCRARVVENVFHTPERLPEYGDFGIKFYPAAGHVLGPVAMLIKLGYAIDSREVKDLIDYFKNYLVAMQLNDDAHDWKEDLARGHISTTVSLLLQEWITAHPDRPSIHLDDDISELEQIFWFKVLGPVCDRVLVRTKRSRRALHRLTFLEDLTPLERFIVINENVARQAQSHLRQSQELLAVFKESI